MDCALGTYRDVVNRKIISWHKAGLTKRLLDGDESVWTKAGEADWLGWVDLVSRQESILSDLRDSAEVIRAKGFTDVLLMGMGGSSLCP